MPATSIFMRALSAGISGMGYSRISVLPGPVRTAANTFSIMGRVSHVHPEPRPLRRRHPGQAMDARAFRRRDGARLRGGKRDAGLSAAAHGDRVLERGTKALPLPRLQA